VISDNWVTFVEMHRISIGLLVLSGCSPELTCELLEDPSNCFAETAVALAACMPMRATTATLSSDQTTCTFADGVTVYPSSVAVISSQAAVQLARSPTRFAMWMSGSPNPFASGVTPTTAKPHLR
jgi:hypothetical protein